jgi:hypothetical protein
MPKTPRGKRVPDAAGESFVVNKAPNGAAEPYFDRTRQVWVAPWRKPDGRVGRPTGKTRALAMASRDRHVEKAAHEAQFGELTDGFNAETTVGVCRRGVWSTLLGIGYGRPRSPPLDLVFTAADGTPTLRQHVDRAIRKAAERAGIDSSGLGTHAGRRSVVTSLFASGSLDLEDVATSSVTTTLRRHAATSNTKATGPERSANALSTSSTHSTSTRTRPTTDGLGRFRERRLQDTRTRPSRRPPAHLADGIISRATWTDMPVKV